MLENNNCTLSEYNLVHSAGILSLQGNNSCDPDVLRKDNI